MRENRMIRHLLPIAMAGALLIGCADKRLPPAATEWESLLVEEESIYDLPLVIQIDNLPEVPERLLGPSAPIVGQE